MQSSYTVRSETPRDGGLQDGFLTLSRDVPTYYFYYVTNT